MCCLIVEIEQANSFLKIKKMAINIDDLIGKLSGHKVFIYGAGYDGKLVHHLLEVNGINVNSFFVDDGYLNENEYKGVQILEISKLKDSSKEGVVFIIAMNTNKNKTLCISKISDFGFDNYFDFDRGLINEFLHYNARMFISKYGIDTSKDYISLKSFDGVDFRIINPYGLSDDFKTAFALEMPDLIVPVIDEQFSFMTEGKYEYGQVVVNENDVVIDCGANIGVFSAIAAAKKAKVYAFEPVPSLITLLDKIVRIYSNITICPYALSDSIGNISFSVSEINTTSHTFLTNYDSSHHLNEISKTITVDTITLDDYVKTNNLSKVDYIKADIEGAERYMLRGATEVLRKYAPKLSICTYHLPDDKAVLESIIKGANPDYVIEHRWQKLYAYVPQK